MSAGFHKLIGFVLLPVSSRRFVRHDLPSVNTCLLLFISEFIILAIQPNINIKDMLLLGY